MSAVPRPEEGAAEQLLRVAAPARVLPLLLDQRLRRIGAAVCVA